MEAIKLTKDRYEELLPPNIRDSTALSSAAKKVFAVLLNYFLILDKAKETKEVYLSNRLLKESVGIKIGKLLPAVQELIDCKLVERKRGSTWTKGVRPSASKYSIVWDNLFKEVKKPSLEELISCFLSQSKTSETPMGTIDIDIDLDIDKVIVKDIDLDIDKVKVKDIDLDIDKVKVKDIDSESVKVKVKDIDSESPVQKQIGNSASKISKASKQDSTDSTDIELEEFENYLGSLLKASASSQIEVHR